MNKCSFYFPYKAITENVLEFVYRPVFEHMGQIVHDNIDNINNRIVSILETQRYVLLLKPTPQQLQAAWKLL
jgi:hypothetical protein